MGGAAEREDGRLKVPSPVPAHSQPKTLLHGPLSIKAHKHYKGHRQEIRCVGFQD